MRFRSGPFLSLSVSIRSISDARLASLVSSLSIGSAMVVVSLFYFETYDSHLDILLLNNLVFNITSIVKEVGCNKGNMYGYLKVECWLVDDLGMDDRRTTRYWKIY